MKAFLFLVTTFLLVLLPTSFSSAFEKVVRVSAVVLPSISYSTNDGYIQISTNEPMGLLISSTSGRNCFLVNDIRFQAENNQKIFVTINF